MKRGGSLRLYTKWFSLNEIWYFVCCSCLSKVGKSNTFKRTTDFYKLQNISADLIPDIVHPLNNVLTYLYDADII